jgi:hypothetical protein
MEFDVAMPLTLFVVTVVSMFLNDKAEGKLKGVFEERKFAWKDAVVLVGAMVIMIFVVVLVPGMALMALFLFSYSMLLFIFTYLFSGNRWYVAILPPAMFVLFYLFLNSTSLWSDYLINVYGVVFAVLITLYIGSLFTWKTAVIFAGLLTVIDIILVLGTGTMISAATKTLDLKLPVLVTVQTLPPVNIGGAIVSMRLGLGDFFFAGLLAIQTFKKYGKRFAVLSVVAMTVSFFVFEAALLTYSLQAFPGTLMIITGWLPLIAAKEVMNRAKKPLPVQADKPEALSERTRSSTYL